ncbi:hypothetical protein [Actinophytocola sp.]|uniref:hypothetical protein n=1 Tax=Actinophytocola sp. TaxID=1872138 RepID=UPI002D4623C9|nr:hypothetical protein [Actinophytocola sp.]HYQ64729.1 hypothetical protein [Actinophytocola sp.]
MWHSDDRDLSITGRPPMDNRSQTRCPRMYWRSVNPALPPPDSLTCLGRGPDCCVTSAVADVRRVA